MSVIGGRYTYDGKMNAAANGQWCFAVDNATNEEVFIKEFANYRYPAMDIDRSKYEWAQKTDVRVDAYKRNMEEINRRVGEVAGVDGDVVVALRFFRDDIFLYKVNKKVDFLTWPNELHDMTVAQTDAMMARLLGALNALHVAGIIHNDLKPDNIFVTRNAAGNYVGKLSDFDDSFFVDKLPDAEDIVSTLEYNSPEMRLYIITGGTAGDVQPGWEIKKTSDVFTMGLIYHEYLTGDLPGFEENDGVDSCAAALMMGQTLKLSPSLDLAHRTIIEKMLSLFPQDRYSDCNAVRMDINTVMHHQTKSHGVVVRCNGQPVADQTIELLLPGEMPKVLAKAKTDTAGKVIFKDLVRMKYCIRYIDIVKEVDWSGTDTEDYFWDIHNN